jgi:hypothetical protein
MKNENPEFESAKMVCYSKTEKALALYYTYICLNRKARITKRLNKNNPSNKIEVLEHLPPLISRSSGPDIVSAMAKFCNDGDLFVISVVPGESSTS